MPSACAEAARRGVLAMGLVVQLMGPCGASERAPGAPAASAPSLAESTGTPMRDPRRVQEAVQRLRADPLLSGTHTAWQPRWKERAASAPAPGQGIRLWRWLGHLAQFIADTSRLLVYALAVVLFAVLVVVGRRWAELRRPRTATQADAAVDAVRGLDVRPASLPEDVGGAAWALWSAGDARAALSLLYRGALSRLIHRHGVPIADSSTEGDCLDLARGRLDGEAVAYFDRLVAARTACVYGRREPVAALGRALCLDFGPRLGGPAASGDAR